jgi:hypothetical protein
MTNSLGHALMLLTICFMGAGLLLTLMTYAESTLDRDPVDDATPLRSLLRRMSRHSEPQVVRAETPTESVSRR